MRRRSKGEERRHRGRGAACRVRGGRARSQSTAAPLAPTALPVRHLTPGSLRSHRLLRQLPPPPSHTVTETSGRGGGRRVGPTPPLRSGFERRSRNHVGSESASARLNLHGSARRKEIDEEGTVLLIVSRESGRSAQRVAVPCSKKAESAVATNTPRSNAKTVLFL